MRKSARERAEAQFTETQKKTDQALKDRERDRQKTAEKMARLRALRLARDAGGKEAPEAGADSDQAAPTKES